MDTTTCRAWGNAQGFSLSELMLSLLIMSIGLMAILKMQIYAMQMVSSAFNNSVAAIRAESLYSITALQPTNFSSLLINWNTQNLSCLPEARSAQYANHTELSWYDSASQKRLKIQINNPHSP